MDFKRKLRRVPGTPGVYLFKGEKSKVIYLGKAANLRKRIGSYFSRRTASSRTEALLSAVRDFDWIETATEAEALLYEASLIKEFRPRYNAALKDDKSYPLLRVTKEKFPRIFITRRRREDGSTYFGPYTNAKLLRQAVRIIRNVFPFRTCRVLPRKACLDYHLGQCPAPCIGRIGTSDYEELMKEIILFISGKREKLLRRLTGRMKTLSKKQEFEQAAMARDQIRALSCLVRRPRRHAIAAQKEELKEALKLAGIPERIEAFDVSNLAGTEAVGSMVVFSGGKPDKSGYRRFRIRRVTGRDDYAMIGEVIRRRYEKPGVLPDLILIDGGKGHLNTARAELKNLGLGGISAVGIAKEFEHIFIPGKREPLILPPRSSALHLLKRVRDEAHRFAVAYHHRLRKKIVSRSLLEEIAGVGEKRKRELLKAFGGIEAIRKAGVADLLKVNGMNRLVAQNVVDYFKRH